MTQTNPADCTSRGLVLNMFEEYDLCQVLRGCIFLLSADRTCAPQYHPMSHSSNAEKPYGRNTLFPVGTLIHIIHRGQNYYESQLVSVPFSKSGPTCQCCTPTCSDLASRGNPKGQTILAQNHTIRHVSQCNLGFNRAISVITKDTACSQSLFCQRWTHSYSRKTSTSLPSGSDKESHRLTRSSATGTHYPASSFKKIAVHPSAQLTLASLRSKFWVLPSRAIVRSVLYKCMHVSAPKYLSNSCAISRLPKSQPNYSRIYSY